MMEQILPWAFLAWAITMVIGFSVKSRSDKRCAELNRQIHAKEEELCRLQSQSM